MTTIKGEGFNPNGGGFTHLHVDGVVYDVETVARAMEFYAELGSLRHVYGAEHTIEHDGFRGQVIGWYRTLEGKPGVVLQQVGTRVVHVYGMKWINS